MQAYYAGDRINVEVDVVLDEGVVEGGDVEIGMGMGLRDSHDLGESLQYVIEGLPVVERAL